MKASIFYSLSPGAVLHLKPQRAADYGLPDRLVHFVGIRERPGYSVPYIIATGGYYRPSDFARLSPQQNDN